MAWYDTDWTYRKEIDTSNTLNDNDGTFNYEFTFHATDSDFTKAQSSGDDILFTDSDGTTKLTHEIESWDSGTGEITAHISLDYTSGQSIYIYYGNGSASNQEGNPWTNSDYLVAHLSETSGDPLNSSQGTTMTNNGATQGASGQINTGYEFDDANTEYIYEDLVKTSFVSATYISAWFNIDDTDSIHTIASHEQNSNGDTVSLFVNTDGTVEIESSVGQSVSTTSTVSTGQWHHAAGFIDNNGDIAIYLDGVEGQSSVSGVDIDEISEGRIGANGSNAEHFDGTIDEVRISGIQRTPAKIENDYEIQNNLTGAYTLGNEESYTVVTATQPSSVATMLTATSEDFVVSQQEPATAAMNDGQVTSISATASQFSASGTQNSTTLLITLGADSINASSTMNTVPPLDEFLGATQATASFDMLTAVAETDRDSWLIRTQNGDTYTIDTLRLDSGYPQFKRGREMERVIIFHEDNINDAHQDRYDDFIQTYNRYMTEDAVRVVQTYDGLPHYTENINPRSDVDSFLMELEPNPSLNLEDWWVLVTDIKDETRHPGPSESVALTMLPIAPRSEGDRDDIESNFEV